MKLDKRVIENRKIFIVQSLVNGKNAKEIADDLNIDARNVHYLISDIIKEHLSTENYAIELYKNHLIILR